MAEMTRGRRGEKFELLAAPGLATCIQCRRATARWQAVETVPGLAVAQPRLPGKVFCDACKKKRRGG